MWTKIFTENDFASKSRKQKAIVDFEERLAQFNSEIKGSKKIVKFDTGESNSVYLLETNSDKFVVKYFGPSLEEESALRRDLFALSLIYPECNPKILKIHDSDISFLRMEYLAPKIYLPFEAYIGQKNISIFSSQLEMFINRDICICKFFIFFEEEFHTLKTFEKSKIDSQTIMNLVEIAKSFVLQAEKRIVHGDYGPNNIFQGKIGLIAIDWEDSFWSIPDYDYLYWLTFRKNEKFLTKANLILLSYPVEVSIGILLLIISLKEIMALKSNTKGDLRISAYSRLKRVINMLG